MLIYFVVYSYYTANIPNIPGGTVSDLEYADDVVLLSEDPGSLHDLLCSLDRSAAMFGMRFAPPKCKMMLQDWVRVTPNLSIKDQFIKRIDKFTYLGSCITPDGSIAEELSSHIRKARLAFPNLHHLWRRNDIKLSTKGRVYSAAVRSVLLYGSETWPLTAEDVRRLSVFDHRCLRCIGKIWWKHRISNIEVRRRVLRPKNISVIEQLYNHRLWWLGHVLCMSDNRLSRRALFAEPFTFIIVSETLYNKAKLPCNHAHIVLVYLRCEFKFWVKRRGWKCKLIVTQRMSDEIQFKKQPTAIRTTFKSSLINSNQSGKHFYA